MNYFVSWEIDVKADSPLDAARMAREAQIRPGTRSTVFQVLTEDSADPIRIDLTEVAEGDPVH